jgi:hypothetical protein
MFEKTDPGTFTVAVKFKMLSNATNIGPAFTARTYGGTLFSLTPIDKNKGIGYASYSYFYIRGRLKPKYDAGFVYLLPYKKDVKVHVAESNFLGATYFGETTPADWKAYRFYTQQKDTVTAIRKGVVVEIKDLYETNSNEVVYTSKTNELIIEHADGTLATYRGFQKGSFMVKVGETVFPNTPLGLNSKYDVNGNYNISLMITYLKSATPRDNNADKSEPNSYYGFVTPHFMTAESADHILTAQQAYVAASNNLVIRKEMSKKELKQLVRN